MSKYVKVAQEQIIACVTDAINKNISDGTFTEAPIPQFKTEIPADRKNGDYSANAAFMLSKPLRMPPRKIAEEILNKIDLENTYFKSCEVAGPGFINFFLKAEFYADILTDIDECGDSYGKSNYGNGKRINVEFVSANPTGPMHMGNARGGALGDCLAAVLEWAGYEVSREFYVNDAGNRLKNSVFHLMFVTSRFFWVKMLLSFPRTATTVMIYEFLHKAILMNSVTDFLSSPQRKEERHLQNTVFPKTQQK